MILNFMDLNYECMNLTVHFQCLVKYYQLLFLLICLYYFPEVLELWRNADVVCFDVDSTVCIDELAEFCGVGKAVAGWTYRLIFHISFSVLQFIFYVVEPGQLILVLLDKAMGGSVPFEVSMSGVLSLFKPSLAQVQEFIEKRPPRHWRQLHLDIFFIRIG